MHLTTVILTVTYLIVQTLASGTGDAALRGFEQSDSDDAELAHTMQMRAHIPRFVGKRTLGEDEVLENLLLNLQDENIDDEEFKKLMYLLKNNDDSLSEISRLSEDFNTQSDGQSNSDPTTFERDAKWAPRFVGKRRSPMFVGRRRAPLFVGKRYAPRFVGKRGAPMFVGRRGSPMFVGRRDSPLFIGRRENARPADTSFYVGGKRSVIDASDLPNNEHGAKFTDMNFNIEKENFKEKRERELFVLPEEMHFVKGKPVYSDFSKRFQVPEFVGKRETAGSDMQNILSEKRFDTPFFVGRRSVDIPIDAIDDSSSGFSFTAHVPVAHSRIHLLKSVNGRT